MVADSLRVAFDRDGAASSFERVAIYEVRGDVERLGDADQKDAAFSSKAQCTPNQRQRPDTATLMEGLGRRLLANVQVSVVGKAGERYFVVAR